MKPFQYITILLFAAVSVFMGCTKYAASPDFIPMTKPCTERVAVYLEGEFLDSVDCACNSSFSTVIYDSYTPLNTDITWLKYQ